MASQPIVFMAVAIAIGLVCYFSAAEGSPYTPAQWHSDYDRVFSPPKGKSLSEAIIVSTIEKLHTGATKHVDEDKKAIVDFFYDANEHKSEHCSSEWIKRLNKPYETYVKLGNSPMSLYCSRLRVKTKKMCSERFVDWARTAMAISNDKMTQLVNIIKNTQNPLSERSVREKLAELFGFGATTTSNEDFKKAWLSGPCSKMLSQSQETAKIIRFVQEIGPHDRPQAASTMLNVIDTCKTLQGDRELKAIYVYVRV